MTGKFLAPPFYIYIYIYITQTYLFKNIHILWFPKVHIENAKISHW